MPKLLTLLYSEHSVQAADWALLKVTVQATTKVNKEDFFLRTKPKVALAPALTLFA